MAAAIRAKTNKNGTSVINKNTAKLKKLLSNKSMQ
jgi:hypothetical protein